MIYATLTAWVFLILLMGLGLYRFWTRRLGGAVVDWLMLPGALLSEVAYSAGRMITGRPAFGGIIGPQDVSTDACRFGLTGKGGFLVAMLASLLTLLFCGMALALVAREIGQNVIRALITSRGYLDLTTLPKSLPTQWDDFWKLLFYQIDLLRRAGRTVARLNWLNWRVPLFIYLSAVLAMRLGSVRHNWRAALVVAAGLVGLTALAGLASPAVGEFVEQIVWPLLTYLWTLLLVFLAFTLLVIVLALLVRLFLSRNHASNTNSH